VPVVWLARLTLKANVRLVANGGWSLVHCFLTLDPAH
jgi:hypothetical protein